MQAEIRRIQMLELMQKEKQVAIKKLANEFEVTTMTIRRDLALFEKQGLVTITHGGAILNKCASNEPSFVYKIAQMSSSKKSIAQMASHHICSGETIILDSGSTTYELVKYLGKQPLSVITNSLPAINYLKDCRKIRLIGAPGQYSDVLAGFSGTLTIQFYHSFKADKVFMSTKGFDFENGATVSNLDDSVMKKVILNAAKEKYLLVDHTKINQHYLCSYAKFADFDWILTDEPLSEEMQDQLRAHGIKWQCANE